MLPARPIEPDRRAWADAIVNGELRVLLAGIDRPERGRKEAKYTWLGWMLVSSGRYMDEHCAEVAEGHLESDYDDDWREHCEEKVQEKHCCDKPSVCDAYRKDVETLFADEGERRSWAYDRVDVQWEWQCINDDTTDVDWVAWFLKKHPITHVADGDSWTDVDEVVGFCQACYRTLDRAEAALDDCPSCGSDNRENRMSPLFRWPPGASAPLHLDGTLMAPPPESYEEFMNAARERRRRVREDAPHRDGAGTLEPR